MILQEIKRFAKPEWYIAVYMDIWIALVNHDLSSAKTTKLFRRMGLVHKMSEIIRSYHEISMAIADRIALQITKAIG